MQLARFECLCEELGKSIDVKRMASSTSLFRFFNGVWYDQDSNNVIEQELLKNLSHVRFSNKPWKQRQSCTCYLPLQELDVVVVAKFPSSPRSVTQDKFIKVLSGCYSHAKNAFDATHDLLTGLYNKATLEAVIIKEIDGLLELSPSSTGAVENISVVGMIAADIDYFKQVNDTNGHLYGDLVLKVFARRIETLSKQIAREHPSIKCESACNIDPL